MAQVIQPVFASLDAKALQQLNASIVMGRTGCQKSDFDCRAKGGQVISVTYLRINHSGAICYYDGNHSNATIYQLRCRSRVKNTAADLGGTFFAR